LFERISTPAVFRQLVKKVELREDPKGRTEVGY